MHRPTGSTRTRCVVVTASASPLGLATVRALCASGARVVTVDRCDADVLTDLASPSGRGVMVHEVARVSGGVVDAVVVPADAEVPGAEHLYFAPVAALGGLRPMLAGSPAPAALAVVRADRCDADLDDRLLQACLDGDEGRAIERADRLLAAGEVAVVRASCSAAVRTWVGRHAPTREWAGRGIPLLEVEDRGEGLHDVVALALGRARPRGGLCVAASGA